MDPWKAIAFVCEQRSVADVLCDLGVGMRMETVFGTTSSARSRPVSAAMLLWCGVMRSRTQLHDGHPGIHEFLLPARSHHNLYKPTS